MQDQTRRLYDEKDPSYFANVRHDIIREIGGTGLSVLEIGCGSGATLLQLRREGIATTVAGVEINEKSVSGARHLLDRVVIGNIEQIELPFTDETFDVIVMADVIEHLIDPWSVVKALKRFLKPNGRIIASIPNIQEKKNLVRIYLKGDFSYEDWGVFDRTHLRFFCRKNVIELFEKDYRIIRIRNLPEKLRGKKAILNRITGGRLIDFFTMQFVVVAEKT